MPVTHSSRTVHLVPATVLGGGDANLKDPGFLPGGVHRLVQDVVEENQLFQHSGTLLCSRCALTREAPAQREEIKVGSKAVMPQQQFFHGDSNKIIILRTMSL